MVCSQFIDPPMLYTKGYRHCPKYIVKYTIKYTHIHYQLQNTTLSNKIFSDRLKKHVDVGSNALTGMMITQDKSTSLNAMSLFCQKLACYASPLLRKLSIFQLPRALTTKVGL